MKYLYKTDSKKIAEKSTLHFAVIVLFIQ